MTAYTVTYRAMNGHRMTDTVEAVSPEAASASIKNCGMLVAVESVVAVADDFNDYVDEAGDAFWDAVERRSDLRSNEHFGA